MLGRIGIGAARGRTSCSPCCAPEVHTFWPVITTSSPSTTPRVLSAGEVGAGVGLGEALAVAVGAVDDPRQEVGLLLVGAPHDDRRADQPLAHAAGDPGTPARANSSFITATSMPVRPRPPNSFGHETHRKPASWSLSVHVLARPARRRSWPARRRRRRARSGWLASSHGRTSSRNAAASGPRSISIGMGLRLLRCVASGRRAGEFELRQVAPIAERLPREADGRADGGVVGLAADDVRHEADPVGQLDEGDDVGRPARPSAGSSRLLLHGGGVDGAGTVGFPPCTASPRRGTAGRPRAGRRSRPLAGSRTAAPGQRLLLRGLPEGLAGLAGRRLALEPGLRLAPLACRSQGRLRAEDGRGHARQHHPGPVGHGSLASGTWRGPHSPRSWRTASTTRNIPYMPGWV